MAVKRQQKSTDIPDEAVTSHQRAPDHAVVRAEAEVAPTHEGLPGLVLFACQIQRHNHNDIQLIDDYLSKDMLK